MRVVKTILTRGEKRPDIGSAGLAGIPRAFYVS